MFLIASSDCALIVYRNMTNLCVFFSCILQKLFIHSDTLVRVCVISRIFCLKCHAISSPRCFLLSYFKQFYSVFKSDWSYEDVKFYVEWKCQKWIISITDAREEVFSPFNKMLACAFHVRSLQDTGNFVFFSFLLPFIKGC